MSPTAKGDLLVSTEQGAILLAADGARTALGVAAERIGTTPEQHVFLHEGTLAWQDASGGGSTPSVRLPGATDVLGWAPDTVLVSLPGRVVEVSLSSGAVRPWSDAPGVTALALGLAPGQALGVRGDELLHLEEGQHSVSGLGVTGLRQVASDCHRRLWGLVDDALVEITQAGPVVYARHLGDPTDLHAGTGGPLPLDQIFVADATGTIAFLPLPEPAGPSRAGQSLAKPAMDR